MPQNIHILVIGTDLEKHMLWPIPLVNHFLDDVLALIQPKPDGPLLPLPRRVALDLQLHTKQFSPVGAAKYLQIWKQPCLLREPEDGLETILED